jgi:two-component system OmpR family response regulator
VPLIVLGSYAGPAVRNFVFGREADNYLLGLTDPEALDRLVRTRAASRQRDFELKGPGDITIHVRVHEVFVGTERLALAPKEFSILRLLLEPRSDVVETARMSLSVWGRQAYGSRNLVEAHILRLHQKLDRVAAGSIIATVCGIGCVIR